MVLKDFLSSSEELRGSAALTIKEVNAKQIDEAIATSFMR